MNGRVIRDRHVVYLQLTGADRARLSRLATEEGTSMSGLLRTAMNDWLESIDEAPLSDLKWQVK